MAFSESIDAQTSGQLQALTPELCSAATTKPRHCLLIAQRGVTEKSFANIVGATFAAFRLRRFVSDLKKNQR